MAGKERGTGLIGPEDGAGTASVGAGAVVVVSIGVVASTFMVVGVVSEAEGAAGATSAMVKDIAADESSTSGEEAKVRSRGDDKKCHSDEWRYSGAGDPGSVRGLLHFRTSFVLSVHLLLHFFWHYIYLPYILAIRLCELENTFEDME